MIFSLHLHSKTKSNAQPSATRSRNGLHLDFRVQLLFLSLSFFPRQQTISSFSFSVASDLSSASLHCHFTMPRKPLSNLPVNAAPSSRPVSSFFKPLKRSASTAAESPAKRISKSFTDQPTPQSFADHNAELDPAQASASPEVDAGKLHHPSLLRSQITDLTVALKPTTSASTSATPSPHLPKPAKQPKVNVGGSSKLIWFNTLLREPRLKDARDNLIGKIGNTREHSGCLEVVDFKDTTRPTLDKRFYDTLHKLAPDAPERFMPYQLALIKSNTPMPDYDPPSYPQALRHVSQKRNADQEVNKPATWVISHLCHNKLCVNSEHLTWEPSWFNRLRDNCPGGAACPHRPHPCLKPHR